MNAPRIYYMNASEVLDYTIAMYKETFTQQMIVSAVTMVLNVVLVFVLGILLVLFFLSAGLSGAVGGDGWGFTGGLVTSALLIVLALVLLFTLVSAVTLSANMELVRQAFYKEKPDASRAFRAALRAAPRVMSAALAIMIIFIPLIVVYVVLLVFVIMLSTGVELSGLMDASPGVGAAVSALIFTVLFMIMFLFLSTVSVLALPVSLFERKYFFAAVGKGFRLIKSEFLKIFGLIIMLSFVVWGIQYSFIVLFDLLTAVAFVLDEVFGTDISGVLVVSAVFRYIGSMCAGFLVAPIGAIFTAVVYLNQKMKREGLDIEMGIEAMRRKLSTEAPL